MKYRKIMSVILIILVMASMFSMTVYASSDGDGGEDDLRDILIPIPIVVTPEQRAESEPLTPPGNLTLVDDARVDTIEDKQFMTVVTKNGNYFYIIVDRDGQDNNVHFLNQVDELDLFALLEDDVEIPEPKQPEPYEPPSLQTAEPEPTSEPEKNSSGSIVAAVVLLFIAGGGAAVYFKVIKPKQAANSSGNMTSLEDLDGDDDEFDGGDNEYNIENAADEAVDDDDSDADMDAGYDEPDIESEDDYA